MRGVKIYCDLFPGIVQLCIKVRLRLQSGGAKGGKVVVYTRTCVAELPESAKALPEDTVFFLFFPERRA